MPVLTAKILLNSTRRAWTQIYEQNSFVALISLEAGEEQEAASATEKGHEALSLLQAECASSENLAQHLPSIVERLYSTFSANNPEVAACVVLGDYIYFAKKGLSEIWAIRDQKPYRLSSDNFSGRLDFGDLFLLGTAEFFKRASEGSLEEILKDKSTVDEVGDAISPLIHRSDDPKAGGVIIKAKIVPAPVKEVQPEFTRPNVFKRLLVKLAYKLPEREFTPNMPGASRRTAFFIGVMLLVLLSVSIFFGIKQKGVLDYKASYQDRLSRAQVLYNDAVSLKGSNILAARDSFTQAKAILTSLKEEGVTDPELDQLKTSLDSQESDILGQSHIPASPFSDLAIFKSDINASDLSFSNGTMAVLDTKGERVVFVGSKSKETAVSGKAAGPLSVSTADGKTYVLGTDGISEVDKLGGKVIIPTDSQWTSPVKLAAFGSNLYLLEKGGVIWKYPGITSGFGSKQEWLKSGSSDLVGNARAWAIDGSVYVLGNGGTIAKYVREVKDSFRVSELSRAFGDATSIYTDPSLDSLYVLDKGIGRVVELDKTGSYKFEYVVDEARQAGGMVVSQADRKIFLLVNNKIFSIPLK
ncbi:MAG: hypothetical protein A2782_03930 [Candidatus Blackburnbacteria bacterium RIFCSPHIGHO2_01_FULL_43_15b]|uniref:PPM-type phosphatase domain-containing protein n=1 Tax=Candidatus Blackburnbacteria bacterium RIFCSPHIGHO2_01_FULL_43_15b TaxID=1797513 RepID=A0A1G1UYC0_9BACT|nr:MAG: hypothetical protein A2782_03930 [Candidatus Blackburnbacteria bacterium RIFCSPHIGHO2_01_FULL_43_15b]